MEDIAPEGRSGGEGPDPGDPHGPKVSEAAGWADVVLAQEALERPMRSRWWLHLPEGLGVAGIAAFVLQPGAPLLLYVCSLLVAVLPRSLYVSLRGLDPRYFASAATRRVMVIGLISLPVLIIAVALLPGEPTPLGTGAAAVLLGAITTAMLRTADRRFVSGLPTLGSRLVSRSRGPGQVVGPLQHPPALRTVVLLAPVRTMRRHRLEEALRLSPADTTRVLEPLEGLGLLESHRQFLGSRRPEHRWYRLTDLGGRALGSHLTAMAERDAIEQEG